MKRNVAFEFAIDFRQSMDFARLSGDFNPLHIDPIAARRTQFGSVVVHGIHLLLRALDGIVRHFEIVDLEPQSLSVTFSNPVAVDAIVVVDAECDAEGRRVKFSLRSRQRSSVVASLELGVCAPLAPAMATKHLQFERTPPGIQTFPPEDATGEVPLSVDPEGLANLFPALADGTSDFGWISDLLATTQIVGMRCPGMHSIFSGFKLRRQAEDSSERMRSTMSYHADKIDGRFNLIVLAITGARMAGTVEALFRPPPMEQNLPADLSVSPGSFKGHQILVIGGSRGLGEVTAKIVAAGGGEVTITYATGAADAERVSADCHRLGGRCGFEALDFARLDSTARPQWLEQTYSHVYFFASPHIARNQSGAWDQALFEGFARVYVHGFAWLLEQLMQLRNGRLAPKFLYPSTVFLDESESGFSEYCVAKAAGEALCAQLALQHKVIIARPRLPKMRTDQTLGVRDGTAADPFPALLGIVQGFQQ